MLLGKILSDGAKTKELRDTYNEYRRVQVEILYQRLSKDIAKLVVVYAYG